MRGDALIAVASCRISQKDLDLDQNTKENCSVELYAVKLLHLHEIGPCGKRKALHQCVLLMDGILLPI